MSFPNLKALMAAAANAAPPITYPAGTAWTKQTGISTPFGANPVQDVASNGSIWVAVGNAGVVASSTDGVTWTARTSNTTNTMWTVKWVNGAFWALGGNMDAISSTDGITWTNVKAAIQTAVGATGTLRDIIHNGSKYVIVGALTTFAGKSCYSTNGTSWTNSTSYTTIASTGSFLQNWVTYCPATGNFVALTGSSTPKCMTSADGITWTAQASFGTNNGTAFPVGIASNTTGGVLMAGSGATAKKILKSTDGGVNWAIAGDAVSKIGTATVQKTRWVNDRFMVPCTLSSIMFSTDGTTWTNPAALATAVGNATSVMSGIGGDVTRYVTVSSAIFAATSP